VAWRSARTLAAALPGDRRGAPRHPELAEELRRGGCKVLNPQTPRPAWAPRWRAGVTACADARGWVVALADMPWLSMELVRAVALTITSRDTIAAPWRDGQRGHWWALRRMARGTAEARRRRRRRALLKSQPVTRILTDDDGRSGMWMCRAI
jgi:molybdenum cofactor cytidylyltransferase